MKYEEIIRMAIKYMYLCGNFKESILECFKNYSHYKSILLKKKSEIFFDLGFILNSYKSKRN